MQKRRVALVEDEAGLLELFTDILSANYEVLPFNSPEDFLAHLSRSEKSPFEILVTDLKMQGINGVEMIEKAQEMGFYFPSILLSGFLDKKAVFEAVEIGVYRLLEKPTSPEVLIQAIEELLVEYDVKETRNEIRHITHQLREYYSYLRLLIGSRIPEADLNTFSLQINNKGQVVSNESFDSLLERLEGRLEKLLGSENTLDQMRSRRYKKIS